ncbi:MAG TPA: RNA polymerase subunit sigma-70 [Nitrospiraceae bacterium]|nr:RNA polymerase subunit sigma-70 [Nitrospiraceae bacterium]
MEESNFDLGEALLRHREHREKGGIPPKDDPVIEGPAKMKDPIDDGNGKQSTANVTGFELTPEETLEYFMKSRSKDITSDILNLCILSLKEFLKLEIPERFRLLPYLPEGGLMMVYGPRGLGKTYMAIGLTVSLICNSPFLKWQVSGPAGVLYIDGEMSLHDLRERFLSLLREKPQAPVYFLSHEYFYQKIERDLNLANSNIQETVKDYVETHPEIKVIVFDNLSCLLPGVREDKRDDWTLQVLPFLLWLRRRGIAVVLVHHSGKSGEQRGTSSREDTLDTVIRLDRIPNAKNAGAQFIIRFVKSRGAYGDDVNDIECHLNTIDGVPTWSWKPLEESTEDRLMKLVAEGVDSVSDMADELAVSKGLVSRIKKKLQEESRLAPGKDLKIAEAHREKQ